MSRSLNHGTRFLGAPVFIGRGRAVPSPVGAALDATQYEGAAIYGSDGQFYYSDGVQWRIPTGAVDIARPGALPPTNSEDAAKLRLTQFFSPRGLSQTGVYFEVAGSQDGFDTPVFTRDITSATASAYQTIYPGDGLTPGQAFWWRGLYKGTEGGQSEFSVPVRQVYPDLIDTPDAVTPDGAKTGAVELTPFNSEFGLTYVETQIEFWLAGSDPEVDIPDETVTAVGGAQVTLPETLLDGAAYIWRGRYGGRAGGSGPVIHTGWTVPRNILNGAASMQLVFDPGLALNRTVYLPLGVYGGLVDVAIDWGDGIGQTVQSGGVVSHVYDASVTGLVTVTVSGQLEQYGGNANLQGLVRVENIGFKMGLTSLREAFRNVTNNTAYVNPALPPQVTTARGMFRAGDPGFDAGMLNTSNITDMSEMFMDAVTFNDDISGLDTSNVTTMEKMFFVANDTMSFNQPIGSWDVSKVRTFRNMFGGVSGRSTQVFNQDIGGWDTRSATDMSYMFAAAFTTQGNLGTNAFNNGGSDSIRNWNVSNVTDFSFMFATPDSDAVPHAFNQPLDGWDVSAARFMNNMFEGGTFSQPLEAWDVRHVEDFTRMFSRSGFNASLAGWNLSSATSVEHMLHQSPFNSDTTNWVLPSNAKGLVNGARDFNHASALSWDVSGVTNMEGLFQGARAFNQDISGWDVSNVTNMKDMFAGFTSFNRDISGWDVSNVSIFDGMFYDARDFSFSLGGWPLSKTGVSMSLIWDTTPIHGEPYSRTLIGWANTAYNQDGPFSVPLTGNDNPPTYDATVYSPGSRFGDAVSARAFLTRSRRVLVASAGTADAEGHYLWNGAQQQFGKSNGWHFFDTGTAWELRDGSDAVQATAQDAIMPDRPYKVAAWDGALSAASVDLDGMGWTITDGGLA